MHFFKIFFITLLFLSYFSTSILSNDQPSIVELIKTPTVKKENVDKIIKKDTKQGNSITNEKKQLNLPSQVKQGYKRNTIKERRSNKEQKSIFDSGTYLLAFAGIFSGLVALFLTFLDKIQKWIKRPKLMLCFDETGKEPYVKNLAFNPYYPIIELDGSSIEIFLPMLNSRLKIRNYGKSTAKNVQVRIEKIELIKDGQIDKTIHYHPTKIKWSGEFHWNPVDIVGDSHFFLDLFYTINANKKFVENYLYNFYDKQLSMEQIQFSINKVQIPDNIYWNLWVEQPKDRGIFEQYNDEGDIRLYFVINGENVPSLKFTVEIHWTKEKWDQPKIAVKFNGKYAEDC
jgi:hypothetical protein